MGFLDHIQIFEIKYLIMMQKARVLLAHFN